MMKVYKKFSLEDYGKIKIRYSMYRGQKGIHLEMIDDDTRLFEEEGLPDHYKCKVVADKEEADVFLTSVLLWSKDEVEMIFEQYVPNYLEISRLLTIQNIIND